MTNNEVNLEIATDFESQLVEGIEPIRQFVVAISLYHFFHTGVYQQLKEGAQSLSQLCTASQFDSKRFTGFLQFLHNEQYILLNGDSVEITKKGLEIEVYEPWYIMLIGGYAETFMQMGENLYEGKPDCIRNAAQVGVGSCGISQFDAIPLTKELMADIKTPVNRLLDLGCGNARYLVDFCQHFENLHALGTEPSKNGYQSALELIKSRNMSDRIQLKNLSAQDFLASDTDFVPDLLVLGFVLHEILGQDGESGVKAFLKSLFAKYPKMHLIVIEVDNKYACDKTMAHPLSAAYYNAYYLLHAFTTQKLVDFKQWEAIFKQCGLQVHKKLSTHSNVDSTGLEAGYLLSKI